VPELLVELFCEEIPARMQARAAEDLCTLVQKALAPVLEGAPRGFGGPRRLTLVAEAREAAVSAAREERGPRLGAPDAALEGFCRKHGVTRDALVEERGFWVLHKQGERVETRAVIAAEMPKILRSFPWPKSMRWGGSSGFVWVRPLRRILCVFDGAIVPFDLREGEDDGHGLASADLTEGHRFLSPGAFPVRSFAEYEPALRARHVLLDAAERQRLIREGLLALAARESVSLVADEGLVAEVAGLVEWPVPLMGRIDDGFMDLPPEVMRATLRVNQRCFVFRDSAGAAAPFFATVANVIPRDGGAAIIAGNERVIRARLSDARFFWDQDRKRRLEDFLPKLDTVVFHAKLGTQGQRVARIERLARLVAEAIGADAELAARAGRLCKADLASGIVGEFPELQGVMGGHYARVQGEDPRVAAAVAQHYRPLGPGDEVPGEKVAAAVALADKLDTLVGFFAADERPTGSGDPYALRRAALGVIRILREGGLRVALSDLLAEAFFGFPQAVGATASPEFGLVLATEKRDAGHVPDAASRHPPMVSAFAAGLLDFLLDRLRVQLRAEGARHDILNAAFGAAADDDLVRLLARTGALTALLASDTGANLLAAYRRAQNILRIEDKKDGPHDGAPDAALYSAPEEQALAAALDTAEPAASAALAAENFADATAALAALRAPLDAFFEHVTVNDDDPNIRRNRLRLLARLRGAMNRVADFSQIEG
jgi:glycyl-tRNA synthetase beta chain